MSGDRLRHELTADQQRLVEAIGRGGQSRLLVVAPPGAGKTYAAAAAVGELFTRKPEARVLVLAPAALSAQLMAMLSDSLPDATFVTRVTHKVYLGLREHSGEGEWQPGVYLLSLDLAKREDIGASVAARAWDMVIVDEAHTLSGNKSELVVRLANGPGVRSLVLLGALPPRDSRLVDNTNIVRWKRITSPASHRVHTVISYERTSGEQELYLRLQDLLDTQATNKLVRDPIERAWRSSISALERVLVIARSRFEITKTDPHWVAQRFLFDPLVLGAHERVEPLPEEMNAWADPTAAATGIDELLRHISSLRVDSKLEAALEAVQHRRAAGESAPSVITAMRETAIYIVQALESRQQLAEAVTGERRAAPGESFQAGDVVIVATDVGLLGLELATDMLLSYDLPRSRLRIEQRWGRVDRVGREQPVEMFALRDLSSVDPIEEALLSLHGFAQGGGSGRTPVTYDWQVDEGSNRDRSQGGPTSKQVLKTWVVEALRAAGGSATVVDVSRRVWENHESDIRAAGDLLFTWQYDLRWAAHVLRREGAMRAVKQSPRGVWELV